MCLALTRTISWAPTNAVRKGSLKSIDALPFYLQHGLGQTMMDTTLRRFTAAFVSGSEQKAR